MTKLVVMKTKKKITGHQFLLTMTSSISRSETIAKLLMTVTANFKSATKMTLTNLMIMKIDSYAAPLQR